MAITTKKLETRSFEFRHWREAFQYYLLHKEDAQIVISTHWATSGYWVEQRGKQLSDQNYAYVDKEAEDLMKRVEHEISLARDEHRGPRFIM